MKRLLRISLCLLVSSLPLAALQAQPPGCAGDGIRAAPGTCTCCPDPTSCCCEMAPSSQPVPTADHPAIPVPSHAHDPAAIAPASWLVSSPASLPVAPANTHAIQVHPEKSLARLHVLQI